MDTHLIWVADHIAYSAPPHTHDFYHLIFCRKKGGIISIDENIYTTKTDFIYFAKPGILHHMERGNDMQLIEIKFIANGEMLNKYLCNIPEEFQLNDIMFMKMILPCISKESSSPNLYRNESANSALKLFLANAIRQFNPSPTDYNNNSFVFFESASQKEKNNTDIMILSLGKYIEDNIEREITIQELANKVFLSKTYFIRRFKILWGMPPMNFVNHMRIDKAKKLLLTKKFNIQQVSEKTGFNSIHYFSRTFKNFEGISPSSYYKYFNKK